MWVALDILDWFALSLVSGVLWGVIASGGWVPYWHNVCHVYAPSNVSDHGDLSEGR
jgi:hypothetical protein